MRVTEYEDDHEKEISQSDGETMKEVIINEASTLVDTVINSKAPSEGFGSEKTSTVSRARMTRGRVLEQTFHRIAFRFPKKEIKRGVTIACTPKKSRMDEKHYTSSLHPSTEIPSRT